ncbi:MAG TPA: PhzF family phenazine biosynthesis protein [Acidobacteriaceae bacterium]|nr:PhzF family phenazine biosynthesis protein [Acidobacteriaceae bacterium]
MREFEYRRCDVFSERPLEGNQLAVFLDATNLTDDEMQAVAREMNLSETTFLQRREVRVEQEQGVRVRIFTTQEELPFAGHPTLGTAATIRQAFPEYSSAEKIVLDLNAGQIAVTFPPACDSGSATFGEMRQLDPVFGLTHDLTAVARVLGLRAEDIAETSPQTVSTGMAFCITVLRSIDALTRLKLDTAASERYLPGSDAKFFYTLAPVGAGVWRARMQFYGGEDPATGSAAGCAISYLVQHGFWRSGERLHLRQGVEMGRPSDLYISANFSNGKVGEVRVGGSTVPVAKGFLFLT